MAGAFADVGQTLMKDDKAMVFRSKTPAKPVPAVAAPEKPGKAADPYDGGDTLPIPEAVEKNSDSVWAMWSEAVHGPRSNSDATQPAPLLDTVPAALLDTVPAPLLDTVPAALAETQAGEFHDTQPPTELMGLPELPKESEH